MKVFVSPHEPRVLLVELDGGPTPVARVDLFSGLVSPEFEVPDGWDEVALPDYCAGEDW